MFPHQPHLENRSLIVRFLLNCFDPRRLFRFFPQHEPNKELMQLTNDHISVTLDVQDDEPFLSLHHAETGREWGPVPLVELDVYNAMGQCLDRPRPVRVQQTTPLEDGVHVELFDRFHQIVLGMVIKIREGRLAVRMSMSEWVEHDDDVYRLYTAHVLPGIMSVGPEGDILLPLHCGRRISPADKPEITDQFLIYGEQSRWQLLPTLPVVSVGAKKTGLAAVATSCAEDANVRVWTDGQGEGGVDAGACLRQNWIDPVDELDREIEFVPITPSPDLVHATADVLRRHVVEDMGMKTLAKRAEESETVRYLFKAPSMKMRFGVRNQGIGRAHPLDEGYGEYLNAMTFPEATEMLREIKDAGVDHLQTISVGILPNGHDGCYPSHDRFDFRSGGREGFRKMVETGKGLGFKMNVHDNFNEGYEISPDFEWRWCSRDIHGEPQRRGRWGGGQAYLQWMLALPEERVEGALRRMKALGLNGMGYIDAVGNPLYRNYSEDHGGPRRDHARGIERVLEAADEIYGAAGIEVGFLYAARHCASVCSPNAHYGARPMRPEWPISKLGGELVPLYNLALSGLIMSENRVDHAETRPIMETILLGLHPRINGVCRRGLSGGTVYNEEFRRGLKRVYDLCSCEFGHLAKQRLVRWIREEKGVERTEFEDGTEIIADFNEETLVVNGKKRL